MQLSLMVVKGCRRVEGRRGGAIMVGSAVELKKWNKSSIKWGV